MDPVVRGESQCQSLSFGASSLQTLACPELQRAQRLVVLAALEKVRKLVWVHVWVEVFGRGEVGAIVVLGRIVRVLLHILLESKCEKMWPRAVQQGPHVSEEGQGVHHLLQERVPRTAGHESVDHQSLCVGVHDGVSVGLLADKAGVAECEGVQWTQALHVQVSVHPAELVQHHVAEGVSTLDVLRVGIIDGQQGGETVVDQLTSALVRPQPVLPVWVVSGPRPVKCGQLY